LKRGKWWDAQLREGIQASVSPVSAVHHTAGSANAIGSELLSLSKIENIQPSNLHEKIGGRPRILETSVVRGRRSKAERMILSSEKCFLVQGTGKPKKERLNMVGARTDIG